MIKKILIDNGHGCDTPGKRSPDAARGLLDSPYCLFEYEWNREEAQMLGSILACQGFDVELIVPEEYDVPLAERVKRVNKWCKKLGNDNVLLISEHVNAAGRGKLWLNARGWTIYTTKGITKADYLAEEIYQQAVKEFLPPLSIRTGGVKPLDHDKEENFYIIYRSYCPAVLIENFFQDNKEDVLFLNSQEGKARCAHVAAEGIISYVNKYCK